MENWRIKSGSQSQRIHINGMTNSAIEEIRKNPEKKYDCDLYL
jgi:hypothetical protein